MKLFITYEYFLPAYKAGGPVQSLANLAANYTNAHIYIFCRHTDMDGNVLTNVRQDEWVTYNHHTKVYYSTGKETVYDVLTAINPDVVFINGIFSPRFNIKPLLWTGSGRKIVSARGMLHSGALSQKSLKKKLYLVAYKLLGLHKKCVFHATTEEEKKYIRNTFGSDTTVYVAPNFPNVIKTLPMPAREAGSLRLLSVALISPMKNIKLVLEALAACKASVVYDIHGPIKDNAYWEECKTVITTLPQNIEVHYHGAIPPHQVQDALAACHCFILPSKSENFGHAIYEALATGRPVITSHNTPWNDLEKHHAGFNVDINSTSTITNAIEAMAVADNNTMQQYSNGAAQYAADKIDITSIKKSYDAMFVNA
jgi:glycosyltransferase involved in cell wall biosynthesis